MRQLTLTKSNLIYDSFISDYTYSHKHGIDPGWRLQIQVDIDTIPANKDVQCYSIVFVCSYQRLHINRKKRLLQYTVVVNAIK